MKRKLVTMFFGLVVGVMLFLPSITTFAANYKSYEVWSFSMNYRFVEGCANDQYYDLEKGTAYFSGTIKNKVKSNGDTTYPPNTLYCILLREKIGPDVAVGSTMTIGNETSMSFTNKKIGTVSTKSSKYYFQFYKLEVDNYKCTGTGSLIVK